MDTLLAHLGIESVTDEEVDQILAEESLAAQGKRSMRP
jgi:hypothetical protein